MIAGSLPVIILSAACATSARAETKETLLIHLTSPLSKKAVTMTDFPMTAFHAARQGHRVVILFDSEAVGLIKIGSWYGGHTTPMDKIPLPREKRQVIARQSGIPDSSVPDNYGDLLRFLKGKGIELYANRESLAAMVAGKNYDHAVTPVSTEEMVRILMKADRYLTY